MLIILLIGLGLGIYGNHIQDTSQKYQLESVGLTYGSPKITYDLESTRVNGQEFNYEPEVPMYSGIEVHGKRLSLGVSFTDGSNTSEPEDNDYRPTSKVFDIQLSGISDHILWSLYYQQYKNLYLNVQDKDSPTQYHLDVVNYGLGAIYAFNHEVELKSLVGNASLKREKGMSWLAGINFNHNNISSNFTIVPTNYAVFYQDIQEIEKIKTSSASLELGWAGQFIYKKFYINTYFTFGPTYQEQTLVNNDTRKSYYPANNTTIEINTGFTFERSSFGISTFGQRISTKLDGADFSSFRSNASIYYRYFF